MNLFSLRMWLMHFCMLATLFFWFVPVQAGNNEAATVWSNSWYESQDVILSPVQGTWDGYLIAAVFAGGTVAALQNDVNWYAAIQNQRSDWQDKIMTPATILGDGFFQVGASAFLYKFGNDYDRKIAAQAIEGQILVAVFSTAIKGAFTATRPETNSQARDWFTLQFENNSFASGHAMTAFCAAAILGDAYHLEWATFPVAALVAYSRIYNSRHWPSDIVVGAGIGMLIGYTVSAFHAENDLNPGIRFSVRPQPEGGLITATWSY